MWATLQADEVASGILRASPDQVTEALIEAFRWAGHRAVPVIVFNGNGVPGTALIVVGSPEDVAQAERVRDLKRVRVGRIGYRSSDDLRREGLLRVTTSERRRAG